MRIRKATPKDLKEIARLLHEYDLYEHALDKFHKIDKISEIISFNKMLMKKPFVIFFVVEDNKRLRGIISGEYRMTAVGKGAIFHNIFISEKLRGKGYGKKLLRKIENYFKKNGCKEIQSFVFKKNKKAINFYKKLGYKSEEGFDIRKRLKI